MAARLLASQPLSRPASSSEALVLLYRNTLQRLRPAPFRYVCLLDDGCIRAGAPRGPAKEASGP